MVSTLLAHLLKFRGKASQVLYRLPYSGEIIKKIEKDILEGNLIETRLVNPARIIIERSIVDSDIIGFDVVKNSPIPASFYLRDYIISFPSPRYRVDNTTIITTSDILDIFNLLVENSFWVFNYLPAAGAFELGKITKMGKWLLDATASVGNKGAHLLIEVKDTRDNPLAFADLRLTKRRDENEVPIIRLSIENIYNKTPFALNLDRDLLPRTYVKGYYIYLSRLTIYSPRVLDIIREYPPTSRPPHVPETEIVTPLLEEMESARVDKRGPLYVVEGGEDLGDYKLYKNLTPIQYLGWHAARDRLEAAEHLGESIYIPGEDDVEFAIYMDELQAALRSGNRRIPDIANFMEGVVNDNELIAYTKGDRQLEVLRYEELKVAPRDANYHYRIGLSQLEFRPEIVLIKPRKPVSAELEIRFTREEWDKIIKKLYIKILEQLL